MVYTSWTDDELRRALGANPNDADAVAEAARRFEGGALSNTELVEELEHDIEEKDKEAEELREEVARLDAKIDDLKTEISDLEARIEELEARIEELEEAGAGLL